MFGQHGVGPEHAGGVEDTFGDHALPFAKQIRKNSLVGDRQCGAAVGNPERDSQVIAAHQRPRLHQAAQPETFAGLNMFLGHHRRCREKHDRIAHRVQHQRRCDRKHRERTADDR